MDVRGVVSLLLGSLLLVISACSGGEPREVTDDEEVAISTQSSPSCDADNGGLVSDSGEGLELFHVGGNPAAVFIQEDRRQGVDVARLAGG